MPVGALTARRETAGFMAVLTVSLSSGVLKACDKRVLAVLQLISYCFVMTMSPLKVRMINVALPSP
jgi:hypothetical protein